MMSVVTMGSFAIIVSIIEKNSEHEHHALIRISKSQALI